MNTQKQSQQKLAIIAQSLYLANLLLFPGLSFLLLLYYFRYHCPVFGIGRLHLYRAIQFTLANGFLILVLPLTYLLMADNMQAAMMLALFYFVCVHAVFVLVGMFNLSRAMCAKCPFI